MWVQECGASTHWAIYQDKPGHYWCFLSWWGGGETYHLIWREAARIERGQTGTRLYPVYNDDIHGGVVLHRRDHEPTWAQILDDPLSFLMEVML